MPFASQVGQFGAQASGFTSRTPVQSIPTDPTSGKAIPSTVAHFYSLFGGRPASICPGQDAAGNLVDSLGNFDLIKTGAPSYRQAVAGWAMLGVNLPNLSLTKFVYGAGPDPATESLALFAYVACGAVNNRRYLMALSRLASVPSEVQILASALVRLDVTSEHDGAVAQATTFEPKMLVGNRTTGSTTFYTLAEKINAGDAHLVTAGEIGFGDDADMGSGNQTIADVALFRGANAEFGDQTAQDNAVRAGFTALGFAVLW